MLNLNLKLVDENEKFEKVKLVKPHIIFNRLDIKFKGNFELIEIFYKGKIFYVSFTLNSTYCYLGLYMMNIDKKVFNAIVKFINKKFGVNRFYLIQSLNGTKDNVKTIHSLVEFPDTQEEFDARFTSGTRHHRRKKIRLLGEQHSYYFTHYTKSELTEEFFRKFLEMKRVKYSKAYLNDAAKDMLSDFYHITDAYTLTIDGEIAAFALFSILDNEDIYFTNTTFDRKYLKLGIGITLYYHAVEDFIARKLKRLYMGGGEYDWKVNSHAIINNTYAEYFEYYPLLDKVFSIQTKIYEGRERKFLYFLGCKINLKQNKINTNDYLAYYKKIKLDKIIKKYAKENNGKKIIIYGAGQMSKILFENYDLSTLNIVGVADKSFEENKPNNFYGYPCLTPAEVEISNFDNMIIMLLKYSDIMQSFKNKFQKKTIEILIK